MKNHYEILGLEADASFDAIKKAYRKLSIKFHPDKNEGDPYFTSMFRQINDAYQVLSDPDKKQSYDRQRSAFQQTCEQQSILDKRERELRQREQRIRETNIKSQAILNEAERLMKRKPDVPHTTIRNSNNTKLNQVVGLKYFLWVLIVILAYSITTKDRQSIDSSTSDPIANKVTHKIKHKRKRHIRQPVIVKADSIHVSNVRSLDTTTARPVTNQDSIKQFMAFSF